MTNDLAAGASASLKKTIREVTDFLGHSGEQLPTYELRASLAKKLGDLAEKWYERGFKRGHRESSIQMRRGKVPRILECDATREFYKDGTRSVHLKSLL